MIAPERETERDFFAALRRREFARLDATGIAYLDYTGSGLYGASQLARHHELLASGVLGNPHSENEPSRASSALLDAARREVLAFFDVDASTHGVCFTANASGALQRIGESYPFAADRGLLLATDNHNSVLGLREYARRDGAPVAYLPLDAELRLVDPEAGLVAFARRSPRGGLFALPAQSNFSGVRHPLRLVTRARELGLAVVLDLAGLAATAPVSLRATPADYAVLSFYKLFGYPTGIGALVARHEALAQLERPWFAGGTVDYASVQAERHRLRPGAGRFEDGTPDFLGLPALAAGFALLAEVGLERLGCHVAAQTGAFLAALAELRHAGGAPLVELHGPANLEARGGAVTFNLRTPAGRRIPYPVVEQRARAAGVALRGGCFCNPGAAEVALGLDPATTRDCLARLDEAFTPEAFAACSGGAVGAVRVSFGMATNDDDVARAVAVLTSFLDPDEALA